MERKKYRSFSVPEELRESLLQEMEKYRGRMLQLLRENLSKVEIRGTQNRGPLTRIYLLAYYKLKMIELGLENGFINYHGAKKTIGKLPVIHEEKWLKEAYKHLKDYCDGTGPLEGV